MAHQATAAAAPNGTFPPFCMTATVADRQCRTGQSASQMVVSAGSAVGGRGRVAGDEQPTGDPRRDVHRVRGDVDDAGEARLAAEGEDVRRRVQPCQRAVAERVVAATLGQRGLVHRQRRRGVALLGLGGQRLPRRRLRQPRRSGPVRSRTAARSPDHGSGTRQPSRPISAPLVRRNVGSSRSSSGMSCTSVEPELLALVHVGAAGQGQHQQRAGAGPAGPEHEVGAAVAGHVADDVVVRQHPRRRGADVAHRGDRRVDGVAQRVGVPRRQQEVEVEGRVELARAEVAGDAVGAVQPDLADEGAVARRTRRSPRASRGRPRARRPGPSAGDPSRAAPPAAKRPSRSGMPGSLASPWATSMRNPSTSRSSQNRRIEWNSSTTSGLVQSRSGWPGVEEVEVPLAGRPVGLGHPGPRRPAEGALPVVGRLARRPARGPRGTGSGPAPGCPARRPGRPGTTRGRWRCGWARCRRSPGCRGRGRPARCRRSRPACRTAGRRRGSRRRRSRRRPGATGRRG